MVLNLTPQLPLYSSPFNDARGYVQKAAADELNWNRRKLRYLQRAGKATQRLVTEAVSYTHLTLPTN